MLQNRFVIIVLICCGAILTGCFISAGTHGSIKGYQYATKKENLQRAVMAVIKSNSNIYRDTSLDHLGSSPLLSNQGASGDQSAGDNYYNDIKNYVTIKITSGRDTNEYTFRYYGDDEDWKTSPNSELFICYAFDKDRKGGSEGDGKVTKEMAKQFTDVLEKEFIKKINEKLSLQYTEGDPE